MTQLASGNDKSALVAWAARPRLPYETISVKPLSPVLGAEIGGVDLAGEVSDAQIAEIRRALNENLAIIFREQSLTQETHKAFARRFGRLHRHRLAPSTSIAGRPADPEVLAWRATRESAYTAGEGWHADVTCDPSPLWGSLLHLVELPPSGGGDTAFLNMYLAFEALSDSLRAYLETLTAIHDGALPWRNNYGIDPPADQTYPRSEHPVVARHPFTGRKFLFVNAGFTSRIVQLSKDESAALLDFLFRYIERQMTFQTRIHWTPNSVLFWDNWATQHRAIWDYYPEARHGERVSVVIDEPLAA